MDAEMYTGMGDDGTQGTVAIERGMFWPQKQRHVGPSKDKAHVESYWKDTFAHGQVFS